MSQYPGLENWTSSSRSYSPLAVLKNNASTMSTSPRISQGILEPPPNTLPDHVTAYPSSSAPTIYPQFILFGDSITQFGTLTLQPYLQTQYSRRLDVINRGFSGYTAPMGLSILPKLFPYQEDPTHPSLQPQIKLLTIFFGANDAALPPSAQSVALSHYLDALTKIVQYPLFREPDQRTKPILITPPPVNEHQLEPSNTRRACSAAAYALAAFQLSQTLQIPCLDLWSIYMRKAGWTEEMGRECCRHTHAYEPLHPGHSRIEGGMQQQHVNANATRVHIPGCIHAPPNPVLPHLLSDGLHLTKQGYDILFWALMDIIRKDIPDCAPENLPYVLVEWRTALGVE